MEEKRSDELMEALIVTDLQSIELMAPDTEERTVATKNLETLYKIKLESEKMANDNKNAMYDRAVKVGVTGLEIVLPLLAYGKWVRDGYKLEGLNEMLTSKTLRDLARHFKPTRK